MARKKAMTTVYLDPDQIDRLRALVAATSVPMAEYLRLGVELVLERAEAGEVRLAPKPKREPPIPFAIGPRPAPVVSPAPSAAATSTQLRARRAVSERPIAPARAAEVAGAGVLDGPAWRCW